MIEHSNVQREAARSKKTASVTDEPFVAAQVELPPAAYAPQFSASFVARRVVERMISSAVSRGHEASKVADLTAGSSETASDTASPIATGADDSAHDLGELEAAKLVADLEPSIERFARQVELLEKAKRPFPCVWMEGAVPHPTVVDLEACLMAAGLPILFGAEATVSREQLMKSVESAMRSSRLAMTTAHVDDARHYFRSRLLSHVRSRLFGLGNPKAPPPPVQALPFRVFSETRGTRVHVSPAYFFDPTRVFGAPTSPATGALQPGVYIFGVARPDGVWFDSAEFEVPRDPEAYLIY